MDSQPSKYKTRKWVEKGGLKICFLTLSPKAFRLYRLIFALRRDKDSFALHWVIPCGLFHEKRHQEDHAKKGAKAFRSYLSPFKEGLRLLRYFLNYPLGSLWLYTN